MKKKIILLMVAVFLSGWQHVAQAALPVELDGIVITSSRNEVEAHKVSGNVSVISKEQIEESGADTIPEILQQVVGTTVYDNSTLKTSIIDIRGFGDTASRNVLVMVDGRRVNVVDSGRADLVQIPVGAIERIEVIRGGGSVLYGDNAVGGVVNIITKKGDGDFSGKVGFEYGSYGTHGEKLEVSGKEKKLSYYLYAEYLDKKGYRVNSDELYNDFNARFDYEVNDKLDISLQYGFHEDRYQIPGGLSATEKDTLSRRGSADIGNKADTEDQYVKISFDIDPLPGDEKWGHFVIDTSWRDREVFDTFGSANFNTNREIETRGFSGKYIFDRDIFDRDVNFVMGFDYYDHENFILGSGTNGDRLTISKEEKGGFIHLEFETIDRLYVTGGSRYHKAKYTFNQTQTAFNFEEQKPDEVVSEGGLKYEYASGSNVHFNFQQTFRFLTPNEWYTSANFPGFGITPGLNLDLKQQTGTQYEFGIKHNFDNKAIVSVTPYWLETDNEIFFDPVFFTNSNYDEIRRIGVEFGSRFDILSFFDLPAYMDKLEYYANYTYQDPEFQAGANDGKQVPFVPNHQVNTGIVMRLVDRYDISLIGRYVGSRFAINDLGNALPRAKPYFVTNLKVSYNKDPLEIYMTVNNLFDRKFNNYEATNGSLTAYDVFPAPEKNFLWGVNYKF